MKTSIYRKNTQVLRHSVCGSVDLAAGSLIPADGAVMPFRDHFSRTEQGDSRRIGDDHLLDDASGSFFQRQDFPVLIKICLPRRPCLFRKRENLKLLSADRTETPFFLSCLPFPRIFLPPRFRMLHGFFFLLSAPV